MYPDLEGKVVVVTGAGRPRGVGRATALRFAREGARLAIVDVPGACAAADVIGAAPDVDRVAAEVRAAGAEVAAIPADVSDPGAVEAALDAVRDSFGRVDVMVCNAAILPDYGVGLAELTEAMFSRVLAVNLTGTFTCARAAALRMIEGGEGGCIVTVGSRASRRGNAKLIAYAASKFGVLGLSQSLALALAPHRIRVNCVCPGSVDTDMAAAERMRDRDRTGRSIDELRAAAIEETPLGRLTVPEDVASAIVWLASAESAHVTGQALNVNGGSWLS
jgi:NAD(P)-dependent dehydrogenase (short-subunit alcohol dehydrogenase family)